jgi:hypothetical protein
VVHINAWKSWNNTSPTSKHKRLLILPYSGTFWIDYHQQQGHHLPSPLGSSSELLHRLAEDVKLSAHGRHPTVYPFKFCCLGFCRYFSIYFRFLYYFWVFFVETNGLFSSSLGVCYEPCLSNTFSNFQSRSALSINSTLGTMFRLSLGVWEHNFTHRVSFLKKKKKNCVYSCYL